jgi:hypothetical protein
MLQFRIAGVLVRFEMEVPTADQQARQKWRALLLCLKAKLEAVESDIFSFEEEFLAHVVMPDGKTVGQHVVPGIRTMIESGVMPKSLLPDYSRKNQP